MIQPLTKLDRTVQYLNSKSEINPFSATKTKATKWNFKNGHTLWKSKIIGGKGPLHNQSVSYPKFIIILCINFYFFEIKYLSEMRNIGFWYYFTVPTNTHQLTS